MTWEWRPLDVSTEKCHLCQTPNPSLHAEMLISDTDSECMSPYTQIGFMICKGCLQLLNNSAASTAASLDCYDLECRNPTCKKLNEEMELQLH